jgi:hypothetical protein
MKIISMVILLVFSVSAFAQSHSLDRVRAKSQQLEMRVANQIGPVSIISVGANDLVVDEYSMLTINLASILITIRQDEAAISAIQSKEDLARMIVVAFAGYTQDLVWGLENVTNESSLDLNSDFTKNYLQNKKYLCTLSYAPVNLFSSDMSSVFCNN